MADEGPEGVEILGPEPSGFGLGDHQEPESTETSESVLSPRSSRLLIFAGVAAVVVALAVISRPDGDSVEEASTSEIRQVEPADEDPDDAVDAEPDDQEGDDRSEEESASTTTTEPPPPSLPSLRSDLPPELTGTLYIAGSDRSLVAVDWAGPRLVDVPFPELSELPDVADSDDGTVVEVRLVGTELIMRTDSTLLQLTEDGIIGRPANVSALLPSDSGLTFVVDEPGQQQVVFALPPPDSEPVSPLEPGLFDHDLVLIGRWREQMLVTKAGKVWLLTGGNLEGDPAGNASLVTDGEVLSYDGAHLAMLRCGGPADCRIEVGPPDNPRRTSLPVPDKLIGRDPTVWGPTTTVSADGRLVAIVDDTGAFSAPLLIDMQTGEVVIGSDIINGDSPLAWSSDGRFLTYAFGDDLVLRDLLADRIYRIDIDRRIDHLLWVADTPGV